ncbi:hypothetical protein NYE33_20435 [Paenibacillus sp. FSL R10-2199]|uniref:hypothetical protein n=1 Tax=Paenibacillus sp. FSL R10-2199 TaxID=2975348 RepID=UPI0030F804B1
METVQLKWSLNNKTKEKVWGLNLNQLPIQIVNALISASVAVVIFIVLHFFVEPHREKRKLSLERLHKLYSPLYALIIARGHIYKDTMRNSPKNTISLGSIKDHPFLTKEFTEKLLFDNMAFASTELIDAWAKYSSKVGPLQLELIEKFIKIAVKDYTELRKELGMDYDKVEFETGIPQMFRE